MSVNAGLTAADGFERWLWRTLRQVAKRASHREIRAHALVVELVDPETGIAHDDAVVRTIISAGGFDVPDKDAFVTMLRLHAVASRAIAVVLITEAWAVVGRAALETQLVDGLTPSEHPDRGEILCANIEHVDTGPRVYTARVRPSNKRRRRVADWTEYSKARGRFVGILPPRPPTPAQADAARLLLEASRVRRSPGHGN